MKTQKTVRASAAAGAVGLAAMLSPRVRARLRNMTTGLRRTVMPPDTPDPLAPVLPEPDEAHAPGHQHLGPPPAVGDVRRRASWPRRADRNGHPGRFW